MKPFMSGRDIKRVESVLLRQAKNSDVLDILEWGSGGSTFYFSNFLLKNNIKFNWVSIEYNRKWYDRILEVIKDIRGVRLVLSDSGNTKLRQDNNPMNEYVDYPKTLGKKFDVIIVDGRKRRRCLLLARQIIKSSGEVVLHDAERNYYHCALCEYPIGRFYGSKLWIGAISGQLGRWSMVANKTSWLVNRFLYYFWLKPWYAFKDIVVEKWPWLVKFKKKLIQ